MGKKSTHLLYTVAAEQYINFGLVWEFSVHPCRGEVLKGRMEGGIKMEYCTTPESLNNDKLISEWGVLYERYLYIPPAPAAVERSSCKVHTHTIRHIIQSNFV